MAQKPIGQVEITSYARTQYAAGIQNWAIAQDQRGRIYIANNEGLLVYDGTNWQLFPVPNKTILRSISFAADGRLYAGAQDEIGYFTPDAAGRLHYNSLKELLPAAERSFTDVWEVKTAGKAVFFRTDARIFCYADGRFSVYKPASSWLPLFLHNGTLIAQDEARGLLYYQNSDWHTLIEKKDLPPGLFITDAIPFNKDSSLVATKNNGLLLLVQNRLLPLPAGTALTGTQLTCLAPLDETSFLAGTYSNGICQVARNGAIIDKINSETGLHNNTVRCLFTAANGNVWTGLDNGIAYLAYSNTIRHVNPAAFNNGSGYCTKSINGTMYFALSTGLQYLPLTAADHASLAAQPVSIMNGLTWNISTAGTHVLAGRDDGLWEIDNLRAKQLSAATGFWTCKSLSDSSQQMIAAGNYRGMRFLQLTHNQYEEAGVFTHFAESSRYLETDQQNIWISHPYRGVYKIRLADSSVILYSQKNGLPADLDNHVFKLRNKIVFATRQGIYEYNAAADSIVPAREYTGLFGQLSLRYLREDEKGNIWFVHEKMVGVADYSSARPVIYYIPELKNKILSGFENIYPFDLRNVWIGSETGFYLVNYEKYRQTAIRLLNPYITTVQLTRNGDSILYGGYTSGMPAAGNSGSLPYTRNSLRFSFAASVYGQETVEYSYMLKGFDNSWSSWSSRSEKDYTNLPEGRYTFLVKARRGPSSPESEAASYSFHISPPWYRTLWAYALAGLLLFLLLYAFFKRQERKHRLKQELRRKADQVKFEEEQRQMAFQHQLELEKTEKELIKLRNENLEAELESKNAELASSAVNLIQKKEFLLKITDELNKLYKPGKETIDAGDLKKVLRSLNSDDKLDEEWKQFSMHFNKVHGDFLVTLKKKFPGLNAHELKLCAYLRLNLSSKEMARLLSISVRGVEIGRYRLRKKLQLQPKEDLFQFLLNLEADADEKNAGEKEK